MATLLHVPKQHGGGREMVNIMDDDGNSYEDTLANFALDYGSDFPDLPEGAVGREYIPGFRHFTYNAQYEAVDGENPWRDGDVIIAALADIIAAGEARNEPVEPVLPLEEHRAQAVYELEKGTEAIRGKFVTRGPGQSMTYQEKGDEAADYVAAGYPADLSTYPFLQAEVNATGQTAAEAADTILAQKSAWIVVGAAIEEERLKGKINIAAATDRDGMDAAKDAALAAMEAI